jgi:peptidoglycan hydrolase-like protein with peptidoglycan-binding domain
MIRLITASVGINGVNRPSDVRTIQEMLNQVPVGSGGPSPPLKVDEICGPKTKAAIQKFQLQHFGWAGADGRVDPNGPTHIKLHQFEKPAPPPPQPVPPAEPESTRWVIQRLGEKEIFIPDPEELFFRVLDMKNARAALYWLGRTRQSPPTQQVSLTELGTAQSFNSKGSHGLSKLGADCGYISTETLGGQRYSTLILALSSGPIQIPMPQHIIGPGGMMKGPGSVSITGDFRYVKALMG